MRIDDKMQRGHISRKGGNERRHREGDRDHEVTLKYAHGSQLLSLILE